MEYIPINESKLKVMLEREDLEEWDVTAEGLDYANPEAKRLFGDILKYAKREFGFDTAGRRVLLQLFPSRDGGCELFITCVGLSSDNDVRLEYTSTVQRAYSFDCLDNLVKVCKRLLELGVFKESSAYFDEEGRWYLTFLDEDPDGLDSLPLNRLSFICEYGENESPKGLSLYLCEYANPVCTDNAIERLGML